VRALRAERKFGRLGRGLLRLLALGVVIWLIATRIHPAEVRLAFARLKPVNLFPILLLLSPLAVLLRALRWRWLLLSKERLPLSAFVGGYLIGVMANSLLLGKFGDLVKARTVCNSQIDYGKSVAVVAIDRLLEGLALLLVFACVLMSSPLPAWAYRLAGIGVVVSLGGLVALRGVFAHRDRFLKLAEAICRRLPSAIGVRLLTITQRLLAGCEILANSRRLLIAFVYALAVWAVEIATVVLLLRAVSVPISTSGFAPAVVLLVVLNFGTLVPVSPGAVGVYQLLCVFALSPWHVDRQIAFTLGVVMQAVLFIPLYAAGLVWALVMLRKKGEKTALIWAS
jgi:uncharacterized protein (TIRG00374 family)